MHAARLSEAQGHVMSGISAGSRVWIKQNDEVQFGVIQTIATTTGYFTTKGSMVIVMDGGHSVLATTMAGRGKTWDVVAERKEEPA
jgi:hypothetical protein